VHWLEGSKNKGTCPIALLVPVAKELSSLGGGGGYDPGRGNEQTGGGGYEYEQ
jgi:hypothetical protein